MERATFDRNGAIVSGGLAGSAVVESPLRESLGFDDGSRERIDILAHHRYQAEHGGGRKEADELHAVAAS